MQPPLASFDIAPTRWSLPYSSHHSVRIRLRSNYLLATACNRGRGFCMIVNYTPRTLRLSLLRRALPPPPPFWSVSFVWRLLAPRVPPGLFPPLLITIFKTLKVKFVKWVGVNYEATGFEVIGANDKQRLHASALFLRIVLLEHHFLSRFADLFLCSNSPRALFSWRISDLSTIVNSGPDFFLFIRHCQLRVVPRGVGDV